MKQLWVPDAKPRLIGIVLMGCSVIHENPGFPVQDLFSFSLGFADFMVEIWKYIVIHRKVLK